MIQLARVRGVTLEEQFNALGDWSLNFQQARVLDNALSAYKKEMNKKRKVA